MPPVGRIELKGGAPAKVCMILYKNFLQTRRGRLVTSLAKMLKICGPKCALCCTIISIWGIIQLAIMGGFFWIHSVSLAEDLGIGDFKEDENVTSYLSRADDAYENQAYKCWVAVGVYAITLLLSACQLFVNTKRSYETPS